MHVERPKIFLLELPFRFTSSVGISAADPTIPVGTEGIIGLTGLRILRILRTLTDRILRLSLLYI
jgi:hypothetical protein